MMARGISPFLGKLGELGELQESHRKFFSGFPLTFQLDPLF